MKKLSLSKLLSMNYYWLGFSFMWNSLHPIVLPAVLLHLVPERAKNSYLGGLTFIGLVLAALVQPVFGALSDRWRSPWGRRRPLALAGTLLDFVFLAVLAWSGSMWMLLLGYAGLQIVSNIAQGPMQGLLPDLVSKEQLGRASSIKNLMEMGGMIFASLAAGNLLSPQDRYPTAIILVIMAVLALAAGATFLSVHEKPTDGNKEGVEDFRFNNVFKLDVKANRDYIWLLLSRFIFLIGIYGVQAFAQYYIQDVMHAANAVKATGDLMAALALMLVVCALLAGWLTDKFGSRRVIILASLLSAAGCLLLLMAQDLTSLTLFAGVLGAGIGLYLTSSWALASRLASGKEAGRFLGLTNLATAGASAFSKLLGIPIDLANNAYPGGFLGYSGLFVLGALGALTSILLLVKVNEP